MVTELITPLLVNLVIFNGPDQISCWGVYYYSGDGFYNATIGKPGYGVKDITLNLKNYTGIRTVNNGKVLSLILIMKKNHFQCF